MQRPLPRADRHAAPGRAARGPREAAAPVRPHPDGPARHGAGAGHGGPVPRERRLLVHDGRLEWASQNSLKFHGRVAYDDEYNGLALDEAEGERLCARAKDADVLFLANHGVIVCGPSVAVAFDDLYYLERACMLQVLAMGTGKPLRIVPERVAGLTARQMAEDTEQSLLHFAAIKRMLDRDEPGWSRLD